MTIFLTGHAIAQNYRNELHTLEILQKVRFDRLRQKEINHLEILITKLEDNDK